MSRNERTPRTISDTIYITGYSSAQIRRSHWSGWWLAVLIGVATAVVLVYGP